MKLPQTVREARDAFLATVAFYDIKPTTIVFEATSSAGGRLFDQLPHVSVSGWCIAPYWIEEGPDDVRRRSDYCLIDASSDGSSRLVMDRGSAIVVTESGECYPLLQPARLRLLGDSAGPLAKIEIDDEWLIEVLRWGSDEITRVEEERLLVQAALTDGLAQLPAVIKELDIAPRRQQFRSCINGDHPEVPGAEVVFCEQNQPLTRVPATHLPSVQGWLIKRRQPEGAFTPMFALTTAGEVYSLDLDGVSTTEPAMPLPLPDFGALKNARDGGYPGWSEEDLDELVIALRSTLDWLPLERAVSS